ncbi:hypothetical protein CAPTEDRAFT_200696 [Capitella teleta]|uniref:Uncharacterized protein n=1 Tax=Capitella teleta TaxID=283909 RepID=R7T3Q6_CAPTE|nr:hypothetical protein CAPTEDRAFT_200696 [Capitella teleta]|eukprot:ELT87286.1 hypothetical protein CAPTEDRAFT_200696 [Capitella teleta]
MSSPTITAWLLQHCCTRLSRARDGLDVFRLYCSGTCHIFQFGVSDFLSFAGVYCEFESEVRFTRQTFLQLEILQGENDLVPDHLITFLKVTRLGKRLEVRKVVVFSHSLCSYADEQRGYSGFIWIFFLFMPVARIEFSNCCLQSLQDSETSPVRARCFGGAIKVVIIQG